MRAVYFIQETKNADLTMRQQQLLCLRAARRLRWYCCEAVFAEAGTEAASLALRSGVHTFCAKSGHWLEPNGRHWMVLPNYDSISLDDWEDFDV